MLRPLVTVVELAGYLDDARDVFSAAELEELVTFLAANPNAGDLIPGTGGARKLRWGAKGKGKRGGARVITFFADTDVPVFLLACFAKGEKSDMSPKERAALKVTLKSVGDDYRGRNRK